VINCLDQYTRIGTYLEYFSGVGARINALVISSIHSVTLAIDYVSNKSGNLYGYRSSSFKRTLLIRRF